jgi:hypothetical protein
VENTRSDHCLQDNSLQTRTERWLTTGEHFRGYKEFSRIALFSKPLLGGTIPSHPTQDFILLFFYLKSSGYGGRYSFLDLYVSVLS